MRRVVIAILAVWLTPTALAAESCADRRAASERSELEPCYWAELKAVDECRFTFAAGLSATTQRKLSAQPTKFRVSGGRCERWPNRPLSSAGTSVQCVRSGNRSASVTLETADGVLERTLKPVAAGRVPDEPVLEKGRSSPQIEVLSLHRSRDYHQVEFGRICPTCRLLAADVRPSQADATILEVALISTSDSSHWLRCPAGWRCGVSEFTPPNEPQLSGCAGRSACRIWRVSDDESEARDTVQITYEVQQAKCKNCPEGLDYASAHKRWEAARAQADHVCEILPDEAPQLFGTRRPR
jgi:hypothetical protein